MPSPGEEEEEAAAEDMARVCLACGLQPSEYKALTDLERNAFVAEVNRRHRST